MGVKFSNQGKGLVRHILGEVFDGSRVLKGVHTSVSVNHARTHTLCWRCVRSTYIHTYTRFPSVFVLFKLNRSRVCYKTRVSKYLQLLQNIVPYLEGKVSC